MNVDVKIPFRVISEEIFDPCQIQRHTTLSLNNATKNRFQNKNLDRYKDNTDKNIK